jgi:hypothetical protein
MISSIDYSQEEILKNIIFLHFGGEPIECDATYSKGIFYRGSISKPCLRYDITPQSSDVVQANAENLPLDVEQIRSIILDPPFLVRSNETSLIKARFGEYKDYHALLQGYRRMISEAYRVLTFGGKLIFKCQDMVNSGKQHWTHVYVYDMAVRVGFYPKDLFVLLAKSRMVSPRWNGNQVHARKFHSYFWVFEKTKSKPYIPYI